jgi:hypothetical protein
MRLLTQIETKHNAGIPLTKEEVKFLWEIDTPITGFGYKKDPRIDSIRSFRKFDLIELYNLKYKPEEITITKKEFIAAKGTSKFHFGNLDLKHLTTTEGLNLPDYITGDLILSSLTNAQGLKLPNYIGGNLNLRRLTNAQGLEFPNFIGGALYLVNLTTTKGLKLPKSFPKERLYIPLQKSLWW